MRFFSIILAVFTLLLNVEPCMHSLFEKTETAQASCNKTCNATSNIAPTEEPGDEKNCEGKSCNPFQVCGSCVLVCPNTPVEYMASPALISTKIFTYHAECTSQFASEFWQPPKIA